MNISGNNMNSLRNVLFSQMGGNKVNISSRVNPNVNGGVKYKHSYLYYDENGVPFHSKEEADRCIKGTNGSWKKIVSVSDEAKAELAEVVKQDFISTNGRGKPEGSKQPNVINKYLSTIPSKQRNSVAWTLQRMAGDYATRMEKLVRKNNPDWKPGYVFDISILDQLDNTLGGVDFKAQIYRVKEDKVMAMEITNNYGGYASQYIANNSSTNGTKKKDTEQTAEAVNSGKSKSTAEYMSELAKLVPSVECKIGNTFSSAKSGKTLTINPLLLEKMQNDPEKKKR